MSVMGQKRSFTDPSSKVRFQALSWHPASANPYCPCGRLLPGGKADVQVGPSEWPLIAISGLDLVLALILKVR